jgi:hypothetical protein
MSVMVKGIYQRGDSSYQVKITLPEVGRITGTFKSKRAAEAYILSCQAAIKLGKPTPSMSDAADATKSKGMSIKALYERVDRKRWSGNPNCKSGKAGTS